MKLDIIKIGLDPILHFESVARLQSLKLAACELGLSQPAITHSLNKLEENLHVQLCIRSRTQFVLTEAGKRLFALSQEIKTGLRNYQGFLENNESFDGVFSIGILDNIQNESFENAIKNTIHAFPKIKLNIQAYTASEIQNFVSIGELDVGIGIFNQKLNHLSYATVGSETIRHYLSDQHPLWKKKQIKEDDIKNHAITWVDIISRNKLTLNAEIFLENKRGIRNIKSYTNNLHSGLWILRSGTSIVPLPSEFLDSQEQDFRYRHLDHIFKSYVLKQEIISRSDFANASIATRFFLNQFSSKK